MEKNLKCCHCPSGDADLRKEEWWTAWYGMGSRHWESNKGNSIHLINRDLWTVELNGWIVFQAADRDSCCEYIENYTNDKIVIERFPKKQ